MQAKQLMEQFALIADAPQGIQRLREMILQLAVQGKLVPQDPSDEPAAVLLAKIQAEKERLIQAGTIKRQKPLPPIQEDEKPFELPNGWEWTKLGLISQVNPRNYADDDLSASFVPMSLITTFTDGRHEQEIKLWKDIKQGFTHFAEGDIGVAKITPCFENGKAAIFQNLQNKIGAGTTELHIIRPFGQTLLPRYVLTYLKSPMFLLIGETQMTGTAGQKRLPKEFVANNPFPLPPLKEQARIVAKVDALMALCDELEALQQKRAQLQLSTHQAVLESLANAQTPLDLQTAWQRLQATMPLLFTQPQQIKGLRETILQLAVRGKLVPQDPSDEPASVLLAKISAEKERLIKQGTIKRQKPLPPIREEEIPFELPQGWEWARLGDYLDIISGVTLGRKNLGEDLLELPYLRVANVQRGHLNLHDIKKTVIKRAELNKYLLKKDDLLVNEGGDWDKVGRTAIWRGEIPACIHQNHIIRMRKIIDEFLAEWVQMFMNSVAKNYFQNASKQTTNLASINMSQLKNCLICIPNKYEGSRIVAKVDALMALCDEWEARLQAARHTQEQFALAAVALS